MDELTGHTPHRPSWDCLACGKPWPCDPTREALIGLYERVELASLMWNQFDAAVMELPPTSLTELHERFLKWAS